MVTDKQVEAALMAFTTQRYFDEDYRPRIVAALEAAAKAAAKADDNIDYAQHSMNTARAISEEILSSDLPASDPIDGANVIIARALMAADEAATKRERERAANIILHNSISYGVETVLRPRRPDDQHALEYAASHHQR